MWWVSRDVSDIKASLARLETQNKEIKEDLKEHIRRTTNLEGRTESIETHVHMVQGVLKFCAWIAAGLTLISVVGGFIALLI